MTEHYQPSPEEARPEERTDRALELLAAGVESVLNERDFPEYLKTVSHLHTYSAGNTALIYMQKPDARMVAGYRKWQDLGRQVRQGERGITIVTPRLKKMPDPEDPEKMIERLTGWGTGKIFDISQTEGEDIPPHMFAEAGEDHEVAFQLCDRVVEYFSREGVQLDPDNMSLTGERRGSYSPLFKTVKIRPGMPAGDTAKTLIHEAAHHVVFSKPWGEGPRLRRDHEVVAEGAAFAVSDRYGLDVGEYSFHYVSEWSGRDMEVVRQNLNAIQKTAHTLIEEFEDPRGKWLRDRGVEEGGEQNG